MNAIPPAAERIAKRMARAGLCSRRDAERWIAEGRVQVNGRVIDSPALNVTEADAIVVDGKALDATERPRLWLYYKPAGLVVSHKDERGRDSVFAHLPEGMPRVISVGRLDLTTEGLLLLTNDGELARHLELPSTGWRRGYRVRMHGRPDEHFAQTLAKGLTVDGVRYAPIETVVERQQGANCWLTLTLTEGKNREIRKVMEHFGFTVNRLIRVSYGAFQLGKMQEGEVKEMPERVLKSQLGAWWDAYHRR